MKIENSYDLESVSELLTWAQNTLTTKKYPQGKLQVNSSAMVINCAEYLKSMISVISNNRENPTFFPAIDQLREFREKLKEVAE